MAESINNVDTADGYGAGTPPCELGPAANVTRITWSEAGQADFYTRFYVPVPGSASSYALDPEEYFFPKSTAGAFATNVAGVQFRSAVAGTPALVTARLAYPSDADVIPGVPTTSVTVVPTSTPVTGIVETTGTIAAGSGFTVSSLGTGNLKVTLASPLSPVADVQLTLINQGVVYLATSPDPLTFTVQVVDLAGTPIDAEFHFLCFAVV